MLPIPGILRGIVLSSRRAALTPRHSIGDVLMAVANFIEFSMVGKPHNTPMLGTISPPDHPRSSRRVAPPLSDRLMDGNYGEHRFVGDGVWELKIDVGPGYRVYYAQEGKALILLLCAGSKRTQQSDISRAIKYWNDHQSST